MPWPGLPLDLIHVLQSLDTRGCQAHWNVHRNSNEITVNLTYQISKIAPKVKNAPKLKTKVGAPTSSTQGKSKQPRKSPSRLRRDRRRLEEFLAKKKGRIHQDSGQSVPSVNQDPIIHEQSPTPSDQPTGPPVTLSKHAHDDAPVATLEDVSTWLFVKNLGQLEKGHNPELLSNSQIPNKTHSKLFMQRREKDDISIRLESAGIFGEAVLENGRPRPLGITKPLQIPLFACDTTLSLKDKIAKELNSMPEEEIPVDFLGPRNIAIHHLAPSPYDKLSTINIKDNIPIDSYIFQTYKPQSAELGQFDDEDLDATGLKLKKDILKSKLYFEIRMFPDLPQFQL